jgi:hypothetical protein
LPLLAVKSASHASFPIAFSWAACGPHCAAYDAKEAGGSVIVSTSMRKTVVKDLSCRVKSQLASSLFLSECVTALVTQSFLIGHGSKAAAKLAPGQSNLVCLLYCSPHSAYYNAFTLVVRLLNSFAPTALQRFRDFEELSGGVASLPAFS